MVSALLVGLGTMLVSLVTYGMGTALIVHLVVGLIRRGYAEQRFWKNVAVMTIVALATALVQLIQMALWALALLLCAAISNFEDAFYCSAQNYTALGYGDFIPSGRWRLLGPLEAVNGLLLFGLSTALMFAVLSRLIANHLHLQLGQEAVSPDPLSAGGGSGSKEAARPGSGNSALGRRTADSSFAPDTRNEP